MSAVRFKAGTATETALLADSGAVVRDWPYGTARARWELVTPSSIVTPYAEAEEAVSMNLSLQGGLTFSWVFPLLTEAMFHHLWGTVFGYRRRITATVYQRSRLHDPDAANQWVSIVAVAELPELTADGLKPRGSRLYSPLTMQFYNGVYAEA